MHSAGSEQHPQPTRRGAVIWLTGLSGAGKSTLAATLAQCLNAQGHASYVLDGDALRTGLNADLGFSPPTGMKTSAVPARWPRCSPMPA